MDAANVSPLDAGAETVLPIVEALGGAVTSWREVRVVDPRVFEPRQVFRRVKRPFGDGRGPGI